MVFAERKGFLMEHVSHKDKQKEEVCLEKRRDQRQLLVGSQPIPWWKCFFPVFCMIFFLLSRENYTKKCYDPNSGLGEVARELIRTTSLFERTNREVRRKFRQVCCIGSPRGAEVSIYLQIKRLNACWSKQTWWETSHSLSFDFQNLDPYYP